MFTLPAPPLRVVLDTDTFNEVDDQFALSHLLLSPKQVKVEAVYAAPFYCPTSNRRSTSPADGMQQSHEEILRLYDVLALRPPGGALLGSTRFLPGPTTPVESAAALDLIARAMAPNEQPLYVCGIAAATNIASALLIEPRIASRITVVWLGGHAPFWPNTSEFNLRQDVHAARVLLETNVPLVVIPCKPVASHLVTSVAELQESLAPFSAIGKYLTEIVRAYKGNPLGWSKVVWDLAASAYLVDPHWLPTYEAPAPALRDDLTWAEGAAASQRTIRFARSIDRDAIFADFFQKARAHGTRGSGRAETSPEPDALIRP